MSSRFYHGALKEYGLVPKRAHALVCVNCGNKTSFTVILVGVKRPTRINIGGKYKTEYCDLCQCDNCAEIQEIYSLGKWTSKKRSKK